MEGGLRASRQCALAGVQLPVFSTNQPSQWGLGNVEVRMSCLCHRESFKSRLLVFSSANPVCPIRQMSCGGSSIPGSIVHDQMPELFQVLECLFVGFAVSPKLGLRIQRGLGCADHGRVQEPVSRNSPFELRHCGASKIVRDGMRVKSTSLHARFSGILIEQRQVLHL